MKQRAAIEKHYAEGEQYYLVEKLFCKFYISRFYHIHICIVPIYKYTWKIFYNYTWMANIYEYFENHFKKYYRVLDTTNICFQNIKKGWHWQVVLNKQTVGHR